MACEHFVLRAHQRRLDELLELVGDAGDGRMHDQHARPRRQARAHDLRNVAPVGQRGNAGATELQNDPLGKIARHDEVPRYGTRQALPAARAWVPGYLVG